MPGQEPHKRSGLWDSDRLWRALVSKSELGLSTCDFPGSLAWTATYGIIINRVWPETVQEVRIIDMFDNFVTATGGLRFCNQVIPFAQILRQIRSQKILVFECKQLIINHQLETTPFCSRQSLRNLQEG